MSNQLLPATLISFVAGASITWLIFKSRVAITIAELRSSLKISEEKFAVTNRLLTEESKAKNELQEQVTSLDRSNTKLTTELSSLQSNFGQTINDLGDAHNKSERIQADLTIALQQKTSAERDLLNANKTISGLQSAEESYKTEIESYKQQANTVKEENARLIAKFEENEKRLQEQQQFIDGAKEKLNVTFQALSAEALEKNNTSFVTLAKETLDAKLKEAQGDLSKKEEAIKGIINPLNESLKTMDQKINDLEGKRVAAYRDVWNYLDQVKQTTEGLKKETTNLVGALKTSHSRGRYGEIALKRLVEYAGMIEHCHFQEQVTVEDEGAKLRPDMIINLPESKRLVVDSKVPLSSYLKIFETDDLEQQRVFLNLHTNAVRDHLKKLSAKSYWNQFEEAPDFVIMYMHIESSFGAALQAYPELIEEAFKSRVIVATPTILISILMSVGYSWNQIKTMENIEEIRSAAVELFDRSTVFINHIVGLGNNLETTVDYYNKAIGSLEGNFMPQARKINNLSQAYTKKILKDLDPIELSTRKVTMALPSNSTNTESTPADV